MDIEEKIIDYINNELSTEERKEVRLLIESDDMAKSIYEEYSDLMSGIQDEPLIAPDQEWATSFSESLKSRNVEEQGLEENEPKGAKVVQLQSRSILTKVAAAAAILIISILGYNNINQSIQIDEVGQEVYAMRQLLEANLNSSSVSSRIKAVRYSEEVDTQDEDFIRILEKTMREDESAHVRLAATEALKKWADIPFVRESLLMALQNEEDAHVKILLIETLSSINDVNVGPHLDNLINDIESPQYIKDEAHKGIFRLEKNAKVL